MVKEQEYIICAANYYNDGKVYTHKPININIGFVVCGHRHHNCIQTFAQIVGFPYSKESLKILSTEVEGFLTNTNKFVDRKQACRIAIVAEQIDDVFKETLYSEDLY